MPLSCKNLAKAYSIYNILPQNFCQVPWATYLERLSFSLKDYVCEWKLNQLCQNFNFPFVFGPSMRFETVRSRKTVAATQCLCFVQHFVITRTRTINHYVRRAPTLSVYVGQSWYMRKLLEYIKFYKINIWCNNSSHIFKIISIHM